ncbi:bifunctional protein BirA [Fictibacillus macauensis ZFHKF-1]|uniref:Bifunctional ligase/repressor BirA n=1 Tax=Fictibacillus macauensis ZFHKF-1 TaxID=1196324 RepID=I8J4C0_9BACL|nr:biotin--[acetyl-CoA-carboxylase] ligase [Fictibacillus macauensis]EIT86616.1 bifunctional protein BirA [Fictibacillus macauensis ZFHKF-1]
MGETMEGKSMRQHLLQLLMEQRGSFVSGQEISDELGCSRTAIWKHISELRKEGYVIDAVQRKGYQLMYAPNRVTEPEIKRHLQSTVLAKHIRYEESVKSTQEIAQRLSYEHCPEGTLVIADEQTGGRGRLGRSWQSPKGSGIWMSLILRPDIPLQKSPQLTLLAAVSVAKAIYKTTGMQAEIKWPNDILLNGKKAVGILTELQAESDRIHAVIIGIGINVNVAETEFDPSLRDIATSLKIEGNEDVNRAKLVACIMEEMETLYHEYLQNGFGLIKLLWEGYAESIGKRIRVRTLHEQKEGIAKGITEEGVLLLEDDLGEIHHIYSADIEIPGT